MGDLTELRFQASQSSGEVSALWQCPTDAVASLVLAHGAGAGMGHVFMEALAARLADRDIATLRFQFPYTEKGSRRPDPRGVLLATVRSAIGAVPDRGIELPLFVGGKSMGGRMASQALAEVPDGRVRGIVFFGFPLHPAGHPGTDRADHLDELSAPMLFLQGTRDKLAELELLEPICARLPRATLHIVDGADHGFGVLKRSGRNDDQVLDELASETRRFIDKSS